MRNTLAIPLAILMASLILLVIAILMTPEIEVVEDPSFDLIVTAPGMSSQQPQSAPDGEGDEPAAPDEQAAPAPLAADLP